MALRQRNILEALLDLIDQRKGDDWYDECCHYCYDDPWHRGDRYGDEPPTNRNRMTEAVARCECPCHAARKIVGREDAITNPTIHDEQDPTH